MGWASHPQRPTSIEHGRGVPSANGVALLAEWAPVGHHGDAPSLEVNVFKSRGRVLSVPPTIFGKVGNLGPASSQTGLAVQESSTSKEK